MLNETMPSILGSDQAKLAQANAEIDKFKTKTELICASSIALLSGALRHPNATQPNLKPSPLLTEHSMPKPCRLRPRSRNGKSREENIAG